MPPARAGSIFPTWAATRAPRVGWFIDAAARAGFAARGVLYVLLGAVAGTGMVERREQAHGIPGALAVLLDAPLGRWILIGLAGGFLGFAVGMCFSAVRDLNHEGRSVGGILKRVGTFIGAVGHVGLAATAVMLAMGDRDVGHGSERWSDTAMQFPLGRWVVAGAGLFAIGYGIFLLRKAYTADLDRRLDLRPMQPAAARWAIRLGRLGMFARGVVYGTIGAFLLVAAFHADPRRAIGIGGALRAIARTPAGPWGLGVVAVGLVAYGIFMLIEAMFIRIDRPASGAESHAPV